jgi:diguanylate cyclase (GGDEF)-like protein
VATLAETRLKNAMRWPDLIGVNKIGRSLLLTTVAAALAAAPASIVSAGADPTDVTGSVRAIAERAAESAVEEQTLLQIATASNLDAADRAEIEARIRTVDARGVDLLGQLDRLGVDLTQAIRISLGPLPPVADRAFQPDVSVPAAAVYEAATADLLRIASTPDAVTNAPSSSNSPAFGLLAVAALALLALGAAALGNSLRRHPEADELAAMAWSDGLTGLANRRRLDADLARHDDGERPTAAIMVDIDHFKEINDTFGHTFGDEVLREVGEALAKQVRYDDIVYRYGGEEFCVLLPGASTADANDVADRIVSAAHGIELPDGRHVTVSVGVAGTSHGDISGAVRRADLALYSAKEHGRDRAVASDDHAVGV